MSDRTWLQFEHLWTMRTEYVVNHYAMMMKITVLLINITVTFYSLY